MKKKIMSITPVLGDIILKIPLKDFINSFINSKYIGAHYIMLHKDNDVITSYNDGKPSKNNSQLKDHINDINLNNNYIFGLTGYLPC